MKILVSYLAVLVFLIGLGMAQEHAAPAKPVEHETSAKATPSPEKIWANLMEGNKRYVAGQSKAREFVQLRQKLAKGQQPRVVVLTCSDSRVPPELIFDKSLGDLFVVRAAGNIADPVGLGSIEYAVDHLGSSVLVVLGHESCGAVKAACSGGKMPSANLQTIVDKIAPAVDRAKSYTREDSLADAAVKENVHQSAKDVLANSAILRHALKEEKLTVIEAIYKLGTGEVVRMGRLAVVEAAYKLDIGDVVRVE